MNLLTYVHLRNIYRSTGVGRVGRELTERLAQRPDIQLKVLADKHDYDSIINKVGVPWTGFNYAFFDHDTSRQQMLWYLFDRPSAESYWPETDVVYCTAESYVPVRRARLAVTCHDMQLFEPEAHPPSRWRTQQRFKWRRMFGKLRKRASMFHLISSFSAERLAHFFPGVESRIQVIPNAVSAEFFKPPSDEGQQVLAKLQLENRPYVLLPGGLHFRKNAELVLSAWPRLHERQPDLQLVIMGHNDPTFLQRAKELAPSLKIAGFLEPSEVVTLYHRAELVWFPSRYEGFGMPVLEAMACGTPVVTSNTTALPETAGGAAAALLSPDRPNDHVDAILGLLADAPARARASTLGHARAQQFTWERSSDHLAEALKALL